MAIGREAEGSIEGYRGGEGRDGEVEVDLWRLGVEGGGSGGGGGRHSFRSAVGGEGYSSEERD